MKAPLTDVSVRALQPTGEQYKVWDTKTAGFGVRVNGRTKSWIVMFGRARNLKVLGRYPDVSLSDARRKALVYLGTAHNPRSVPFPEARDFYLAQDHWKPRSKYEITRTLTKHFHWTKTLDRITSQDVAAVVDSLKQTPSEAAHAFKDIRAFFNWCVPRFIPHSPCAGLKKPQTNGSRERVLSNSELKAVWKAADTYPFGTIVRLLILTAQRRTEVSSLRRTWIDDETCTLPDTKNNRPHTFPLGKMARDLLATIPKQGDLLFPARGHDDKSFVGFSASKKLLDQTSGISGYGLHDIRRTVATRMAEIGIAPHIIERLLNHITGSLSPIALVYNRAKYLAEMRMAVELWEDRLHSILAS